MSDDCCSSPSTGDGVPDLTLPFIQIVPSSEVVCPHCHQKGKAIQGQTVKALVIISLRNLTEAQYHFCHTPSCPVVYYTAAGDMITTQQLRERVYQKEPDADDVPICYCFRHTAGEVRNATPEARAAIVHDNNAGIRANQCACDLRNPQGSCCLGNVRELIKKVEQMSVR